MKDKITEIIREFNLRRIYDEDKYQLPYEVTEDLVDDILKDQNLSILFSSEGVIRKPNYPKSDILQR